MSEGGQGGGGDLKRGGMGRWEGGGGGGEGGRRGEDGAIIGVCLYIVLTRH